MKSATRPTIVALAIGIAIGAGSAHFYYRTPVTANGIDYTGDNINDERWHYAGGRVTRYEADRNRDGHIDQVAKYDQMGLIKLMEDDNDFDGRFEALTHYKNGLPTKTLVDSDGDGVVEQIAEFQDGILQTNTWFNPVGLKIRKIQYFSPARLETSELDTNGDGHLDTVIEYNEIEEISKKSNKSFKQPSAAGTPDGAP